MLYLDTSAFLKTVWNEAESTALAGYVGDQRDGVQRPAGGRGPPEHLRVAAAMLPRTDLLLADVRLVALSEACSNRPAGCPDPHLRTLDAIHLATALLIREDVESLLTYDERLAAGRPGARPRRWRRPP